MSEKLGRPAVYRLTNKVKKLPYYLTIQMMRFEWNAQSGNKAKILRECAFNLSFDAYDLCTPELQEKLRVVSAPANQTEFCSRLLSFAFATYCFNVKAVFIRLSLSRAGTGGNQRCGGQTFGTGQVRVQVEID